MESGNTDHHLYSARAREQKALHDDKEDLEWGRYCQIKAPPWANVNIEMDLA